MMNGERERSLLRLLLAAAGLDRSETEVEALLPGFRGRREAVAQLAPLDLGDTPLAVGFSAAWRDARSPELPSTSEGGSR